MSAFDKAARQEWAVEQGITLTEIGTKRGASSKHPRLLQSRPASLDAHLQMLSKTGFKTVAVPWKYYGLAVFGGWL
ncbi:hypothetical protein [Nostoc sp.]|uniref:hypothetical protein n=1 Tax=Nostoc sp. TaxID=1180 RepID=UPI002FFB86C8